MVASWIVLHNGESSSEPCSRCAAEPGRNTGILQSGRRHAGENTVMVYLFKSFFNVALHVPATRFILWYTGCHQKITAGPSRRRILQSNRPAVFREDVPGGSPPTWPGAGAAMLGLRDDPRRARVRLCCGMRHNFRPMSSVETKLRPSAGKHAGGGTAFAAPFFAEDFQQIAARLPRHMASGLSTVSST